MKNDKADNWSRQQQQLMTALRDKLSINNISKENHLIANMTPHLEVKLSELLKMDLLKNCKKQTVVAFIKNIPFLQLIKMPKRGKDDDFVRIQYQNSQRRLIVTGIHKKRIEEMLAEFNSLPKKNNDLGKNTPKIINNTTNWVMIETINQENAKVLQKYLRTKKKFYDANHPTNFKIQKKRIRIIIIKQDLFALLIDAMTESKTEQFLKNFQTNNLPISERKDSQQNFNSLIQNKIKNMLVYRPMIINDYQKQEVKDEELSDGFSQSNSLNSEIKDLVKANDVIQTSDQGIQAQNSGQVGQYSDQIEFSATPNSSPEVSPQNEGKHQKNVQDRQALIISQIQRSQVQNYAIFLSQVDETQKQSERKLSPQKQAGQQQINIKSQQSDNHKDELSSLNTSNKAPFDQEIVKQNSQPVNFVQLNNRSIDIQTKKSLYSNIPFAKMKRYFNEFKMINHKMLIQLPNWMVSESEQQRNRHKFYGSLCKPKIKHLRECQ